VTQTIFYGKANKKQKDIKSVVIIQLAKLGDMVCTTPMFRAVKEKYPKAKVIVVGDKINKDVLEGNPDVDNYIVWDGGLFQLIKKLREAKADFGCITGPNFEGLAVLMLAGIPLISVPKIENGWSPFETKPYRVLRHLAVSKSHRMGFYAPREYLRLLEPIGIFTDVTKKYLTFSEKAERHVKKFFEENHIDDSHLIVGISPSAGNKIKNWPGERFAQVADYISDKYHAQVIVFGGPRDEEEVTQMLKHLAEKTTIINALNKFNIDDLKCAISKLNFFIAVDTGPIYIAEALGVATIDIVGPMDENEQPPMDNTHRVVVPHDRGKPELHIMNARVYDDQEARRQTESITVKDVIREIEVLKLERR
jgi:heptosyltransferase II